MSENIKLSDFGQRLKEQRKRLQWTQVSLSQQCGISQRVQSGYETGKVAPDVAYLYRLQELGFDICALLSGEAANNLKAQPLLIEDEERTLLNLYRQAPNAVQKQIWAFLAEQLTHSH